MEIGRSVQRRRGFQVLDLFRHFGGAQATLRSSSGDIAVVDQTQLSVQTPVTGSCFQCNFAVPTYNPQNYIDDDGTYEVAWASNGATGTFVLFTAKYVR